MYQRGKVKGEFYVKPKFIFKILFRLGDWLLLNLKIWIHGYQQDTIDRLYPDISKFANSVKTTKKSRNCILFADSSGITLLTTNTTEGYPHNSPIHIFPPDLHPYMKNSGL